MPRMQSCSQTNHLKKRQGKSMLLKAKEGRHMLKPKQRCVPHSQQLWSRPNMTVHGSHYVTKASAVLSDPNLMF